METKTNKFYALSNGGGPLEMLKSCGGYYKSPYNKDGQLLGPLVGYAGTYSFLQDNQTVFKNFVGYEYFNFAKAESDPTIRSYFAWLIIKEIEAHGIIPDKVIGAPMGGIMLTADISHQLNIPGLFAEKKITALANPNQGLKEISKMVIDRHDIEPGDLVILIEDVCNNFSTTASLQIAIENRGGKLVAIGCAINRSGQTEFNGLGVLSAAYVPAKQFTQEDEAVKELIQTGKIIWKPKLEWAKLQEAMKMQTTS